MSRQSPDPARFAQHSDVTTRTKRGGLGDILGSLTALVLLVVGIPILLLVLDGPPTVPTSMPSLRDFAQQLSIDDLIAVLVAIVWLAWVWFVICVLVEVVAARRGGLGRPLPGGGPVQKLARTLVGALLLTGVAVGPATAATAATAPVAPTPAVGAVVAEQVAAETEAAAQAEAANPLDGHKVYTVAAPYQGYHDNLWDIAERYLGDGRRYVEIFELNKDREQPGGGSLQLARLIHPGWELIMPDDAQGIDRRESAPVTPPTSPSGAEQQEGETASQLEQAQASDQAVSPLAMSLMAAGVLGALALCHRVRAGRRPDPDAAAYEADLRVAATTDRLRRLDVALRQLTGACRAAGVAAPQAYAVILDDTSVELLLAPARPNAVDGWKAIDQGARWRSEPDLRGEASTDVVPYPALVSLGLDDHGRDVLIDLEASGGLVALTGDTHVAEQVAAAFALQASTAPWANDVRVIADELPAGIDEVAPERLRVGPLSDALDELEGRVDHARRDALSGRLARRATVVSEIVISAATHDDEITDRIGKLVGTGRQSLTVVTVGEHPAARWRLVVDQYGTITLPSLSLSAQANRVSPAQVEAVAELVRAATSDEGQGDVTGRVEVPAPPARAEHDDADWAVAPNRVAILGPVSVRTAADLPANRMDLAVEIVTYLSLQPEAVHPSVLAGAIWPRGVTADVRDATIERVRGWLGSDVDGTHILRADAEGRLSVSEALALDWDCVRTLVVRAHRARSASEEIDLLRRALQLVRGPALADAPGGRYAWASRQDLPRIVRRVVLDAALRLARLLGDDDPGGSAAAAQAGLRVVPADQQLWRVVLRSEFIGAGVAGVHRALSEMDAALRGSELEPETLALIEELAPRPSADVG